MLRRALQRTLRSRAVSNISPTVLAVRGQVTNDPEALRRLTTSRWLYDEDIHLLARYVSFNPQALAREAAKAVGAECVRMDKTFESSSNKIYRLTFSDGREAVARLPCPLAGPPHLLTASEVATMQFARNVLNLPVPKVLAWCSRAETTSVGAEFIIMEVAQGVELSKAWQSLDTGKHMELVQNLAILQSEFFSVCFTHHGSLYFKVDVESIPHTTDVFADPAGSPISERSKYAIGPSIDWELWRGTRKQLDTYRGPYCLSLITDTIRCQQARLASFAKPRLPSDVSFLDEKDASPAFYINVFDQVLSCVPATIPPAELCVPTIWHPDLNRGNIFIDPSTCAVTGIIDWQWTTIAPLYMQAIIPRAFLYTGHKIELPSKRMGKPHLPENFDSLSKDEMRAVLEEYKDAATFIWQQNVILKDPLWGAVYRLPKYPLRIHPVDSASRTWTNGLTRLRGLLLRMRDDWAELAGPGIPCPLKISEAEEVRLGALLERCDVYAEMVRELLARLETTDDGMVEPERRDALRRLCQDMQAAWDTEAFGGPFPLQPGCRNLIAE
ncbi:kinase-like domain-containing protein [Cerioporus squamosus]|nr:kinase-like domain-containing protein [Cerioporus squamosus]